MKRVITSGIYAFLWATTWMAGNGGVVGFNLESRLPIIKQGESDSYFGYSVATHVTLSENDADTKW